ncbi:uncharacterized protein [Panulirus ornatus]|uniref:uncharacterized protein n=1 Tax=Panulirus ornatus TaxID=150431 RepID=UPI003A8BDE3C
MAGLKMVLLVASLAAVVLTADVRRSAGTKAGLIAGVVGVSGGAEHGRGHGQEQGHGVDVAVVAVAGGGSGSSGGCRYWCKTPRGQSYCCEDGNEFPSYPSVKPGSCPPVRPQCPAVRSGFRPPVQCSHDSKCPGREKCCFDTCLNYHTCKPPRW